MPDEFLDPIHGFRAIRTADGETRWSGFFDGAEIAKAMLSEDNRHCLVLLSPKRATNVQANLVCVDGDGRIVFRPTPPNVPDSFVNASWGEQVIWASTWSCYRLFYDAATYRELSRVFTK